MIHTLKLNSGVELTYDGLGLRVEGNVSIEKQSSKRSLTSLTIVPIARVHVLHVSFDQTLLRLSALIPQNHAEPETSALDLCTFTAQVEEGEAREAETFCETVMKDVYRDIKAEKRFKVLINPFGGQGLAKKIYSEKVDPVFASARCTVDVEYTEYQGHAVEIARDLDADAYDAVVMVSGDGVIHEVINGFLQRPDAETVMKRLPLGVIPGGTGNALSVCLLGEQLGFDPVHTALQVVKGKSMPLDLCSVTYDDKQYYSFLSHNYGITAYADLGTENMRWMGDARTVLGLLQQIFTGKTYGMEAAVHIVESNKEKVKSLFTVACDHQSAMEAEEQQPTASSTASTTIPPLSEPVPDDWTIIKGEDISFFLTSKVPWLARGMLSHPCALPNDGMLDLLLVRGKHSILKRLLLFAKVETGHHIDSDAVEYYKVKAFRLTPLSKNNKAYVAIDGEHAPVKPFQVEVLPGLASVLSLHSSYANIRHWRPAASVHKKKGKSSVSSKAHRKLRDTFAYVFSIIRAYVANLWNAIFRRPYTRF